MAKLGAKLVIEVLDDMDNIKPEVQDEGLVTYASKIDKSEAKLDFSLSADVLERKIRAFNPYPGCYFEYEGERFKILRAKAVNENGRAGQILEGKGLKIACGVGALDVIEIQRQGKKAMPISDLLRGFEFKQMIL